MEFQSFASAETSALVDELIGSQSEAAAEQLRVLREALDTATQALARPTRSNAAVQSLIARLTEAADTQVRRIREESEAALEALRGELSAEQLELEKVRVALAGAEAAVRDLRTDLDASRQRADSAEQDLATTVDAHATVEADLRKTEGDLKRLQEARAAGEAELTQAHATLEQLLAEVEELRKQVERLATENATLNGELNSAREAYRQRDEFAAQVDASLTRILALDAALAQERAAREELEAALEAGKARMQALQHDAMKVKELREQREALAAQLSTSATRIRALETDLATAAQVREHRDALAAQLEGHSTRVRTLENDLTKAAELREQRDALIAQLEATMSRVRALEADVVKANGIREQRDEFATKLDASTTRIRILETDLARSERIREHRDALAAQLDDAATRIRTLEDEIAVAGDAREQHEALAASADAGTSRVRDLERQLAAAEQIRSERDRFAIQLEKSGARLHALEAELGGLQSIGEERDRFAIQLDASTTRLKAVEAELASSREQLRAPSKPETAPLATRESTDEVEALRTQLDRMVSLFDASARAVAEMAATESSTQLLAELVKRLSLHFSRVALLRVKTDRLEGDQQLGIDQGVDITAVMVPTSVDSILTRAVSTGVVQSLFGDDTASRANTPFGGNPRSAVALPIVLQGTTLAVVYADDAEVADASHDLSAHETSVGFARLLVGLVVVLLVRHTHELKTLAELSQYATTLLQEAKEMHLADTQAGKHADLIRSRLKDNIECASQLYAYRAAMEGTTAAALLDQQILVELQDSTPFARDLAAVVGEMAKIDLEITAEAS